MTPARRLAAILAADVVGYSRTHGRGRGGDGAGGAEVRIHTGTVSVPEGRGAARVRYCARD